MMENEKTHRCSIICEREARNAMSPSLPITCALGSTIKMAVIWVYLNPIGQFLEQMVIAGLPSNIVSNCSANRLPTSNTSDLCRTGWDNITESINENVYAVY